MAKDNCRLCLKDGAVINIFKWQLSSKIISLTTLEIHPNDGLPSTICKVCLKQLDQCTDFIQTCKESDIKLRASLIAVKASKDNEILCSSERNRYKSNIVDKSSNLRIQNIAENAIECPSMQSNVSKKSINRDVVVLNKIIDSSNKYAYDKIEIEIKTENECQNVINCNSSICNGSEHDSSIKSSSDSENETETELKRKSEKRQCPFCGKFVSSGFRLRTHLRTHSGERPFQCSFCNKTFALRSTLDWHLIIHYDKKPFKCLECNARFAHPSTLRAHQRLHSGEKPYLCTVCPRRFHTSSNLNYHIRTHTGKKDFECDSCGKEFITLAQLKQHQTLHTDEKRYMCSVCGQQFTRSYHLKRHMQNLHNSQKSQRTERKTYTEEYGKNEQENICLNAALSETAV